MDIAHAQQYNRDMPPASGWTTRLVVGEYPERKFDIDFWQKQGDEAIFSAAWEMIAVFEEMKRMAESQNSKNCYLP